ncbi:MAG TPA: macro domain-containing protein [Chthoniobacteraceae bacterium]|nr:macro domain-containing protein [Chthoniobacteraceae bacterium]
MLHEYWRNWSPAGFWKNVKNPTRNIAGRATRSNNRHAKMADEIQIGKTLLRLATGDIAEQDTDAVVTAAHWRLNKGTGTDGTIHTKGGERIYQECRLIGGCPIGDAVITTGGNLKARHVIHAVGPVWRGGDEGEPALLASAYRRSMEIAVQNNVHSISFPSISTGAFGYPTQLAAPIALQAVIQFLREGKHDLNEVRMVLYPREDERTYPLFARALEQIKRELAGTGDV